MSSVPLKLRRSTRTPKPTGKYVGLTGQKMREKPLPSRPSPYEKPLQREEMVPKIKVLRKPEGITVVQNRRINLDLDENTSLYKLCREWSYDSPQFFPSKDEETNTEEYTQSITNFVESTTTEIEQDPMPQTSTYSQEDFEKAIKEQVCDRISKEELLNNHLQKFKEIQSWWKKKYDKEVIATLSAKEKGNLKAG